MERPQGCLVQLSMDLGNHSRGEEPVWKAAGGRGRAASWVLTLGINSNGRSTPWGKLSVGTGPGRQTPPGGGHPPLRQTQRRNSSCCRSQREGGPGVPGGPSSAPAAERGGAHGYRRGSSGRRGRSRPRPRSPRAGAAPPPAAARPPSAAAAAGVSGGPAPPASHRPPTGTGAPQPRSRGGQEAACGCPRCQRR